MTTTGASEVLDLLVRSARDRSRKVLLRGGYVLSMDPAVGDLTGDVLIEGGVITAVGPNLPVSDGAIEMGVTESIVMPGLVDSHLHAWEGQLRTLAPDLSLTTTRLWFISVWRRITAPTTCSSATSSRRCSASTPA